MLLKTYDRSSSAAWAMARRPASRIGTGCAQPDRTPASGFLHQPLADAWGYSLRGRRLGDSIAHATAQALPQREAYGGGVGSLAPAHARSFPNRSALWIARAGADVAAPAEPAAGQPLSL